ncbi:MAG: helix-turn-helix domain-containing protein [Oscillospiraceae bacterium]|jgi:transcriptional regulator with XRE-family HTH domain|nr:helix-turn-helix domain-containing protein [Oscillospiraceae bacterium]
MLYISENLKRLRRAKDLTQDDLAELLHVSPQAVSKWEMGSSYPDITLLPVLAEVLDCAVDTLLGMDAIRDREVRAIVDEFDSYVWDEIPGGYQKLIDALHRHPTSVPLLYTATYTLTGVAMSLKSDAVLNHDADADARAEQVKTEAVAAAERLLRYSGDMTHISCAYSHLVQLYACWEEWEKAEEYALKFPENSVSLSYDRTMQLRLIRSAQFDADGEIHLQHRRIFELLHSLGLAIWELGMVYSRENRHDDALAVEHVRTELTRLVFGDDYAYPLNEYGSAYGEIAIYHARRGDMESALANLEKFADFELRQSELFVNPYYAESPLLTTYSPDWHVATRYDMSGWHTHYFDNPCFEALRGDPRFAELRARLDNA